MSLIFDSLMRERRDAADTGRGIGQFRDQGPQPQEAGSMTLRSFVDSLADQPGIRLAQPTGRRVYFGGVADSPQRFVRPPSEVTGLDDIDAARQSLNNARRTLPNARVGGV